MKTLLFSVFALLSQLCIAQYSSDPTNPLIICNETGNQNLVQSLKGTNGDAYVFWLDGRQSQQKKVYAQHLDALGNKLLSSQGVQIDQAVSNVSSYRIVSWQNGFLLAWFENEDSLMAQYLDTNFVALWEQPLRIAKPDSGAIYVTPNNSFNIFANSEGAVFTYTIVWTGGSSLFGFNKIDFDGQLQWGNLNKKFPLNGYDYAAVAANDNGWYALSKGNGSTSGMYAHRFDHNGDTLWNKAIVSAGPQGFGGKINMMTNATNDLYLVWESANSKIMASKLTNAGIYAWNNIRFSISDTTYNSNTCIARIKNDTVYAAFRHQTGFGTVLQMQKFDSHGQILWGYGGVMVDTVNAYYFSPKIALNDSGMVTVFYPPVVNSFGAQKVDVNGNGVWADGIYVCDKYQAGNFYEDISTLDNLSGCSTVFWTGEDQQIYGAKTCVENIEDVTGISSLIEANKWSVYPNPASDNVNISINDFNSTSKITVFNLFGQKILEQHLTSNLTSLNTNDWPSGVYTFKLSNNNVNRVFHVIVQ